MLRLFANSSLEVTVVEPEAVLAARRVIRRRRTRVCASNLDRHRNGDGLLVDDDARRNMMPGIQALGHIFADDEIADNKMSLLLRLYHMVHAGFEEPD